ncbi:hypothetical protein CW304_13510 [Bacillus sp. UFRGS-B20]|nr:hypothetical protein CW304_13510 [Bacillus sp. UFRGS-B20]
MCAFFISRRILGKLRFVVSFWKFGFFSRRGSTVVFSGFVGLRDFQLLSCFSGISSGWFCLQEVHFPGGSVTTGFG